MLVYVTAPKFLQFSRPASLTATIPATAIDVSVAVVILRVTAALFTTFEIVPVASAVSAASRPAFVEVNAQLSSIVRSLAL